MNIFNLYCVTPPIGKEKLSRSTVDQKWDLVKVVCTQPYNKVKLSIAVHVCTQPYNKVQ